MAGSGRRRRASSLFGHPTRYLVSLFVDYTKAKANRFAQETRPGAVAILLDPNIAQVLKSAESVNKLLRALVETMPARQGRMKRTI